MSWPSIFYMLALRLDASLRERLLSLPQSFSEQLLYTSGLVVKRTAIMGVKFSKCLPVLAAAIIPSFASVLQPTPPMGEKSALYSRTILIV